VKEIYITENGPGFSERPGTDERIKDQRWQDFLQACFLADHRVINGGVTLADYFI
jgi:beta-glucosidase/6-phospho-beta-glucosidase/beta-galactosidase